MAVKLNSSSGGSVTLQEPTTASNYTLTLPAQTGTVALTSQLPTTSPVFSAYKSANQTISQNTWTKVTFNAEEFDTSNYFDTTNSKFLPTTAGYYQINVVCYVLGSASDMYAQLYKNGSGMSPEVYVNFSSSTNGTHLAFSNLMYFNGSTDYIELYAYSNGASPSINKGGTHFQGFLVRAA
jgi:hypothetical protein